MASSAQNLFRRSPLTTIIGSLQIPHTPNLAAPRLLHQPDHFSSNPISLELSKGENLGAHCSPLFLPSFPFGFCLNPISLTGSIQSELEEAASGDSGTIWADSVKKKMNKHIYRKLKKRLRRQS